MNPLRGRRWFLTGSIGLIVFGTVHTLAVYKVLFGEPHGPAEVDLHRAMRALSMEIGPFKPTAWHTLMILNSSYSILLLFAGVLDLIAIGPGGAGGRMRLLTLANMYFCGMLFLICLVFQFPPPMVFAGACLVFFTLSLIQQRGAAGPRSIIKRFDRADEVRPFDKGRFEIVHIGGMTIGRASYEPGWIWSEHVRPTAGTPLCQVEHVGLVVSGRAKAKMADEALIDLTPGDLFYVAPGHDSWVEGNEPYVSLHFLGAGQYAKKEIGDEK